VNGKEIAMGGAGTVVASGDRVQVWADRPGSAKRRNRAVTVGDLTILYEDEAVIVVDKPAGLLTVPLSSRADAPSVASVLERHWRSSRHRRPFVVHRIDRDTSGIVVFARTARAQAALKDQFERQEPERVYWALVHGQPSPPSGTWRDRLVWDRKALVQTVARERDPRAADAVSDYRVVESFPTTSLVEVRLRTGKRNQIRIQAALRGYPLVGERQYVSDERPHAIAFPRQALHAHRLAFRHPVDGRTLRFESPIPPDLARLLANVRRTST
jgi:23S rRNA pseudouridine1911/1915/1917 synthase